MKSNLDLKLILKKYGVSITLISLLFITFLKKSGEWIDKYGIWGVSGLFIALVLLSFFLERVNKKDKTKEKEDKYMKNTIDTLLNSILSEFRETQEDMNSVLSDILETINALGDTLLIIKDRLFQFDRDITKEIEHIYQKLEGQIPYEIYNFILQEHAFVISFKLIEAFINHVYNVLPEKKITEGLLKTLLKNYQSDIRFIVNEAKNEILARYFTNATDVYKDMNIAEKFNTLEKYLLENITYEKLQNIDTKSQILSTVVSILKYATQRLGDVS